MPTLGHHTSPFMCVFSLNLHDNVAQKALLLSFLLKKNYSSEGLFFKLMNLHMHVYLHFANSCKKNYKESRADRRYEI